jgi:hypothetical protein
MIPFFLVESILRVARESGAVNNRELSNAAIKLVLWTLGILGCFLLVMILTDPQFCFRRQFLELWDTIIKLC